MPLHRGKSSGHLPIDVFEIRPEGWEHNQTRNDDEKLSAVELTEGADNTRRVQGEECHTPQ